MEATELRIGNLVMDGYNNIGMVDSLFIAGNLYLDRVDKIDGIGTSYNALYKEIKPIPLTGEWLEKFGFEIDGNEFHFKKGTLRIDLDGRFWGYSQVVASEVRIKYVHQLQNLYHSLAGQELTVKELV